MPSVACVFANGCLYVHCKSEEITKAAAVLPGEITETCVTLALASCCLPAVAAAASPSRALLRSNGPLTVGVWVVSLNTAALNMLAPRRVGIISTSRSGTIELKGTLLAGCSLAAFQRQACCGGRADTPGRCGPVVVGSAG